MMPATIDNLMESAIQALAVMDYARCEALCVSALGQARADRDWIMVRRVLLPLQEARRLKRQIATDGLILLGTPTRVGELEALIADERCGCIVLTRPYAAKDAAQLDELIRRSHRAIEVLFADSEAGDANWLITTFHGPAVNVVMPAPTPWVGQWVAPLKTSPPTPAHWFMRASEALGDAALAAVTGPLGSVERFDQLALALSSAGDHEILHQRLAEAAGAVHGAER